VFEERETKREKKTQSTTLLSSEIGVGENLYALDFVDLSMYFSPLLFLLWISVFSQALYSLRLSLSLCICL